MFNRLWTSSVCSTALMTLVCTGAVADDVYMVPLAKSTIESIATNRSSTDTSPGIATLSPASSASPSSIAIVGQSTPKSVPVLGARTAAAEVLPAKAPPAANVDEKAAAEAAAAEPASLKPAATLGPIVKVEQQPEPVAAQATAAPAASAVSVQTPLAPSPVAVTAAPAVEPVATTATSTPTSPPPPVAAAPVEPPASPAPPTMAATAAADQVASPVTAPAANNAPVATTATVPTAAPAATVEAKAPDATPVVATPPVIAPSVAVAPQAAPEPVVSPVTSVKVAPADETAATETPAPAAVVVPVAPVASAPALTQDMIGAALKTAIETHFTGKAHDEKKLNAEEKKAHAAVVAFYAGRNYQPLWVDPKGLTRHADEAIERLSRAGEDGLNPNDYPAPALTGEPTAETLAKAEITLTESTMKYARQAEAGRFDPLRLSELVTAKPTIPDPDGVLKTLASAPNVADALEAYNPQHEGYKRLKAKLAEIGPVKTLAPQARVPAGPTIRPGEKDTRVALLRNRLGVTGTATADDAAIYDDSLVEAVKSFQKKSGLKPSGLIGPQTVDAVNEAVPGADTRAADIIANMERWRWLPRNLGDLYVMVNIPDFALTVVKDGAVTHRTKAIVGRVANQTPVFSDTMTHIIVNPYWNVPYSIVKKEYLGKAQETKGEALTRGNFEVEVGNKTVDPTTVDWATVNAAEVHLRQRPGEGNALGNIKFMFPNQHSVYIHDTSSRGLFVQSYRSLSHGCVRVQDPFSFADALMVDEPTGITGAKLKSMIGGGEKYLWLKKTIPVHIAYFTAFVDDAGTLQTRPDLYGHNARTKQLLGL